jgi:hypothetical protein
MMPPMLIGAKIAGRKDNGAEKKIQRWSWSKNPLCNPNFAGPARPVYVYFTGGRVPNVLTHIFAVCLNAIPVIVLSMAVGPPKLINLIPLRASFCSANIAQ